MADQSVPELDNMPVIEPGEELYWNAAVDVYREMHSGMGCGLMTALSLYCDINHVGEQARYALFIVLRRCFPLDEKVKSKDGRIAHKPG